jgi:hypothetical protein
MGYSQLCFRRFRALGIEGDNFWARLIIIGAS